MSLLAAGGCDGRVPEGSTLPVLDPNHDARWTPYRDAFPVCHIWEGLSGSRRDLDLRARRCANAVTGEDLVDARLAVLGLTRNPKRSDQASAHS
jgi:hypothetical protein